VETTEHTVERINIVLHLTGPSLQLEIEQGIPFREHFHPAHRETQHPLLKTQGLTETQFVLDALELVAEFSDVGVNRQVSVNWHPIAFGARQFPQDVRLFVVNGEESRGRLIMIRLLIDHVVLDRRRCSIGQTVTTFGHTVRVGPHHQSRTARNSTK
jgi:hypothetical protein